MTTESWPEDLKKISIFQSFYDEHETYERYHVKLIGVQGQGSIDTRKNRLGLKAAVDKHADPYVILETLDESSVEYFPIGKHTFPVLKNSPLPVWDAKCTLIAKKESCSGIQLTMYDENAHRDDELLVQLQISREDLPSASEVGIGAPWKKFEIPVTEGRLEGLSVVLSVKVTDGASRMVSKDTTEGLYGDNYEEHVLEDPSGVPHDNSLLQCWKVREGEATKAVFWVLVSAQQR